MERVAAEQNAAAARDGQRLQSLEQSLRALGTKSSPVLLPLPELRGNIHGVDALGLNPEPKKRPAAGSASALQAAGSSCNEPSGLVSGAPVSGSSAMQGTAGAKPSAR